MNRTIGTIRLAWLAAMALPLTVVAVGGCDESSRTDLKEQGSAAQDKASEALQMGKDKAAEVGAEAQQAWESLKSEYAPQIDSLSSKVDSLKEQAAKFKDTQLDGYISQLEEKISQIKSKLSESFSAEGMQSLKDNVSEWMSEAQQLYDKAAARLAELTSGGSTGG